MPLPPCQDTSSRPSGSAVGARNRPSACARQRAVAVQRPLLAHGAQPAAALAVDRVRLDEDDVAVAGRRRHPLHAQPVVAGVLLVVGAVLVDADERHAALRPVRRRLTQPRRIEHPPVGQDHRVGVVRQVERQTAQRRAVRLARPQARVGCDAGLVQLARVRADERDLHPRLDVGRSDRVDRRLVDRLARSAGTARHLTRPAAVGLHLPHAPRVGLRPLRREQDPCPVERDVGVGGAVEAGRQHARRPGRRDEHQPAAVAGGGAQRPARERLSRRRAARNLSDDDRRRRRLRRRRACRERRPARDAAERERRQQGAGGGAAHRLHRRGPRASGSTATAHPMLPRPRLGNDALLPHAPRQQRLTDTVINLVRPRMQQVLTLEINLRVPQRSTQPLRHSKGASDAPHNYAADPPVPPETPDPRRLAVSPLQFLQRLISRPRWVQTAPRKARSARSRPVATLPCCLPRSLNEGAHFLVILYTGARSSFELASTPHGSAMRMASVTLDASSPPATMTFSAGARASDESNDTVLHSIQQDRSALSTQDHASVTRNALQTRVPGATLPPQSAPRPDAPHA